MRILKLNDHFESGKTLFLQGQFERARNEFLSAVELESNHAESLHFLGLIAHHFGQFKSAIELFERAIAVAPESGEYYGNLGNSLEVIGIKDRAIECYARAVELCPKSADLNANFSTLHWHRLNLDAAFEYARRAIAINPHLPAAQYAMGNACKDLGLIDDALWAYKRAKELAPGLLPLESGYLYALNYHPDLSPIAIAIEHKNWASKFAEPITRNASPFDCDLNPDRKLRVGYVSNAFRDHAINFFVEPLLRHHDRTECETYCYSDVIGVDSVTDRLRPMIENWRSIVGMSDDEVAKLIRDDRIDILVDLHGHMGGTRIFVFARRAAPIQVTYIGYQATTGMAAMDYRLTDANADPVGLTESLHSEKLLRLSPTYFCYQPPDDSPEITESPFLKNGYVTFGSFNAINKVSARTLNAWGMILKELPSSKLRVLVPDAASLHQRIGMTLMREGARQDQIEFVIRAKRRRYLERMAEVDIALDPFPFNGHTTSCDALWMGLPVVMLRGDSYVQRYGSSALLALEREEWIAQNSVAYVKIATTLARDRPSLAIIRSKLRTQVQASPLMDFDAFAKGLAQAYRSIWTNYCKRAGC